MATISERLRAAITEDVTFNHLAVVAEESANAIDALVAALERERETFEAIRHTMHADDEIMQACRLATDRIDAALALARKGEL